MNSSIVCRVFSAKTFYSLHPQRRTHDESLLMSSLPLFESGIHEHFIGQNRSLCWIDGLYADTLKTRSFINLLLRQELPFSLARPTLNPSRADYHFCSPELLSRNGSSLLAILNCVEIAASLIDKQCRIDCLSCGAEGMRTPTVAHLVDQLYSQFSEEHVRISAESECGALQAWALDHGFQVHVDDSKVFRITLDTLVCTQENLAKLHRILASLWSLRNLTLTCSSSKQEYSYHMTGWCGHCSKPIPYPDDKTISAYLIGSGTVESKKLTQLQGLYISPSLSLREFLNTPIIELKSYPSEFTNVVELMTEIGLSHLALHTSASELSSKEVASLSVAITGQNAPVGATILIDIPTGLLTSTKEKILSFLNKLASTRAVVLLQNAFVHDQNPLPAKQVYNKRLSNHIGSIVIPSKENEIAVYSHSVLSLSAKEHFIPSLSGLSAKLPYTTHIRLNAEGTSITTFPIFATTTKGSFQTLADTLGLSAKLSKLFAMGLDAKYLGLSPRDFLLNTIKKNPHVCSECRGLGVVLSYREEIHRPQAEGCPLCDGRRFAKEIAGCTFKGMSYSSLLNSTISGALPILTTLPKITELLQLVKELELDNLPLGMPLALMSYSELRRIRFIEVIINLRKTLPNIVLVEEPLVGWNSTIFPVVARNICTYAERTPTTWILLSA